MLSPRSPRHDALASSAQTVEDGNVTEVQRAQRNHQARRGILRVIAFLPVPIARVRTLNRLPARALDARLGTPLSVATKSAVRDAENGEAFLVEVEWGYGFSTRVRTRRGSPLTSARSRAPPRPPVTVVVDVAAVRRRPEQPNFRTDHDHRLRTALTERFASIKAQPADYIRSHLLPD